MHVLMLGSDGASVYAQRSVMNPICGTASTEPARTRRAEVEAAREAMELER